MIRCLSKIYHLIFPYHWCISVAYTKWADGKLDLKLASYSVTAKSEEEAILKINTEKYSDYTVSAQTAVKY